MMYGLFHRLFPPKNPLVYYRNSMWIKLRSCSTGVENPYRIVFFPLCPKNRKCQIEELLNRLFSNPRSDLDGRERLFMLSRMTVHPSLPLEPAWLLTTRHMFLPPQAR